MCILLPFSAVSQDDSSKKDKAKKEKKAVSANFKHKFTTFHLEARAGFQYEGDCILIDGNYSEPPYYQPQWNHSYGFRGDYFNLLIGGDIGDHISYFFRQRIVPVKGYTELFDNTDFLYIQYKFNDQWSLRMGKEAIHVGGFEYDAPPIDVYYYTHYWGHFPCFLLGMSASYTDKSGKNKFSFNIANSPYVKYQNNSWKSGLLSYNLFWSGNFGPFHTLYSVNFLEYQRGKFINFIALGHKLSFDKWSVYADWVNRAAGFQNFFQDFSVVSRVDWHVSPSVNLFAKGGYEQNFSGYTYQADDGDFAQTVAAQTRDWNPISVDMLMPDGCNHWFYGLGMEFRPQIYPDLRVHAWVADMVLHRPGNIGIYPAATEIYPTITDIKRHTLTANLGITWRLDFMKFLPEKLK